MDKTTLIYVAAIAALPPSIAAVAALIVSLRKLNDIHLSMNSRLDELVKASNAQGRQDERDQQKRDTQRTTDPR